MEWSISEALKKEILDRPPKLGMHWAIFRDISTMQFYDFFFKFEFIQFEYVLLLNQSFITILSGEKKFWILSGTSLTLFPFSYCQIAWQTHFSLWGYKTFFMINSAEHKIYPAHKC